MRADSASACEAGGGNAGGARGGEKGSGGGEIAARRGAVARAFPKTNWVAASRLEPIWFGYATTLLASDWYTVMATSEYSWNAAVDGIHS